MVTRETKPKRGKHPLPEDFKPDPSCSRAADEASLTPEERRQWLDQFRDYWRGNGRMMTDWQATARNSIRSHRQRSKTGNSAYAKHTIDNSLNVGLSRFLEGAGGESDRPDLRLIPRLREGGA